MSRIPQLLEYLKNTPEDAFLNYALALEYIKSGQPEEGLRYFEHLTATQPDYIGTYYHLAKLYIHLGRREDAETTYTKGIEIAKRLQDQHALAELQNAALNFRMGLDED